MPGPGPTGTERPGTGGAPARWTYRVVAGDSLWDIAQRYLGDPQRWREIFALNQGRPQPGGRSLTDPALIYPGWILLLPPAHRRQAPAHQTAGPTRSGHAHPGRHRRPPAPSAPAGRRGSPSAATPHPGGHAAGRGGPAGIHLPGGGLAGAALAAAISTALVLAAVQRARRYRPARTLTASLRPTQPPLPAAIAALRAAARPQRLARPAAQAGPAEPPGAGPTPPPAAGAARPAQPGLIAVGIRDGAEVCADLAALGGLGLTGPGAPGVARALLAALLAAGLPGQPAGPAEVIIPGR